MLKPYIFLARDGYILYEIAKNLVENSGFDKEVKYLYVSREVLILSKINDLNREELYEYFQKIFANRTIQRVFEKLKIDRDRVLNLGIDEQKLDLKLSGIGKTDFEDLFLNEKVFSIIKQRSEKRKERLDAYLDREGLFKNSVAAIVDSGWNLTIQDLLADILQKKNVKPPQGYYFGISKSANASVRYGRKNGYFWDMRKENFIDTSKVHRVLEVFGSAHHGRTIDYRINGDYIQPVFADYETKYLHEWGINDLKKGILTFTEAMIQQNESTELKKWNRDIFIELLYLFWVTPVKPEIEIWGNFPFNISPGNQGNIPLFKAMSYTSLLMHVIRRGKLPNGHHIHWPHAYLYAQDEFRGKILRYSLKAKRNLFILKNRSSANLKQIIYLIRNRFINA